MISVITQAETSSVELKHGDDDDGDDEGNVCVGGVCCDFIDSSFKSPLFFLCRFPPLHHFDPGAHRYRTCGSCEAPACSQLQVLLLLLLFSRMKSSC